MYGYDTRSGGTDYSAMDGPGGPILRGDRPQRDSSSDAQCMHTPNSLSSVLIVNMDTGCSR